VFAASNCFLIAATCVAERVGASVMLSGYSDATVKLITGLFRGLETPPALVAPRVYAARPRR
jgi:hypothetical protein